MSELWAEASEPEKSGIEFKDFEEALKRLEQIVGRLEAGELALEEAIELFEEGMRISRFCGRKLDEAERRIEVLVKNAKGELAEEPFDTATDDDAGN
jgi:exodeoxyribonuclease VII small subunit